MSPAETGTGLTRLINQCDLLPKIYIGDWVKFRYPTSLEASDPLHTPRLDEKPQPQYGPVKIGKGGKPKRW